MNPINNSVSSEKSISVSDRVIGAGKVFFFVYLLAAIIGLYVMTGIDKSVPLELDGYETIESWTVTDPEGGVHVEGSTYKINDVNDDTYVMESVLPDGISDDSWLFCSLSREVEVYIDGEFRKDFNSKRDMTLPGGIVKRFYFLVPLESADSGKDICIVMHGTSRQGVVYRDVHVASGLGLISFLITNFSRSLILSEILLLFSFVTVIAGIVMRVLYRQKIDMLYGAVGVFVISAWTVSDSLLWPFIYRHYHIDGVFNYLMSLLMPFGLALYLNGLQHGRYKKIMAAGIVLSIVDAVVWPILHFAGILSFPDALLYINIILGVLAVVVLGVLFVDILKGHAVEYLFTAIGFIGFLVCCIVELILIHSVVMLEDADPMLLGLAILLTLAISQQMHDLRRSREERQREMEMSQAKTRFLASMSHEIRTPINAVLGMDEMILRECQDKQILEYANDIDSAGHQLLSLVNDILDFSKIESGKMELHPVEYELFSVMNDCYNMIFMRAKRKELEFLVENDPNIPAFLYGDEVRIRQIIMNLLTNAVKYTKDGTVKLILGYERIDVDNIRLVISVKDTGIGISEENQKYLFDSFRRIEEKANRNIEGTGLGLSITKKFTEMMGGTIGAESVPYEGSTFTVVIPQKVADTGTIGHFDERLNRRKEGIGKDEGKGAKDKKDSFKAPRARILVVDDVKMNLNVVRLLLKGTEAQIDLAASGEECLKYTLLKRYDVILMDHMMPIMDGIEALHKIREQADGLNTGTPVVALTANALVGAQEMYLEEGFVSYLSKPVKSTDLEECLLKFLPEEKIEKD